MHGIYTHTHTLYMDVARIRVHQIQYTLSPTHIHMYTLAEGVCPHTLYTLSGSKLCTLFVLVVAPLTGGVALCCQCMLRFTASFHRA